MSLKEAKVSLIDCVHKTPPATDSGYPYVAIPQMKAGRVDISGARKISKEHFEEWTKKAKPVFNDVILSRRCNPGETAFVDRGLQCALGQNLVLLRADGTTVYPPILRWLVRSPEWWGQVEKFINAGAVFDSLKCKDIPSFQLTIPPIENQKVIADFLGALDNKIELNRQINQTLEQIAQTIFKSWFVDFEPVKAKIEAKAAGRDPERAAMCAISGKLEPELDQLPPEQYQKLAATAALFPAELVESELGLIPVGWEVGTLSSLCVLNAKSWGTKTIPAQVHYVDLANTKNGEISDIQIFSAEEAPSRARRVLRAGDTIIGTVRPGNRSFALIGSSGLPLTGSTGFAVLTPKNDDLREVVYMLATSESNIGRLTRLADGAAYPAVRPEMVVDEQCVFPSDELVWCFHKIAGPIFNKRILNAEASECLAILRDTLLPKLLSGELAVEKLPEEATA